MTMLFCIREDGSGKPAGARLYRRKFSNLHAIGKETERLMTKWTRVVQICADLPLQVQFAKWAASLLGVNPRYVLEPTAFIGYIRGCNWNHPCPDYAHYEERVKLIGKELWHEFSTYREVPFNEAFRRMDLLLGSVGLKERP